MVLDKGGASKCCEEDQGACLRLPPVSCLEPLCQENQTGVENKRFKKEQSVSDDPHSLRRVSCT